MRVGYSLPDPRSAEALGGFVRELRAGSTDAYLVWFERSKPGTFESAHALAAASGVTLELVFAAADGQVLRMHRIRASEP